MIERPRYTESILRSLDSNPVVALLGPRQSGKTTLARMVAKSRKSDFYDLEDPTDHARLAAPGISLADRPHLVILDEIQRKPELFEVLRVLADRSGKNGQFLVLGSASPRIVRGISESLAGRVGFVDLTGFDTTEVGSEVARDLWIRGGFPRSFLAKDDETSLRWRNDFIRTFLERDIPQLGIGIPAETLRRFWTMAAHYHGRVFNAAEFARSLGSAEATARKYLDILSGAFVVRQLQPWYANIKKRQVKAPKVYIRDSGILHALLSIPEMSDLERHPKLGASWEGFVIEEILARSQSRDAYFWATHAGAELDLLLFVSGRTVGFEIKFTDSPRTTRSMRSALSDLDLDHLYIVYPGSQSFPLDDRISARSVGDLDFDW